MMLNDSKPFRAGNIKALYEEQMKKEIRWRDLMLEELSMQVRAFVSKLMEPDIGKRYTAKTLYKDPYMQATRRVIKQKRMSAAARQPNKPPEK